MGWYKVTFSPDDISAWKYTQMQTQFENLWIASGAPRDAELFNGKDDKLIHYFNPGAARIAMPIIVTYDGVECPEPPESELHRLVSNVGLD